MKHEHHRHCGEFEGRDRQPGPDSTLTDLLRGCGHILYHRHGWNRSQDRVMRMIAQRGRMSQKELQDLLDIKSSSISEMISKLETKGLVRREKDGADKRKMVLVLTEAGSEAVSEAPGLARRESYDALSAEEQETLRQLLIKLLGSWQNTENSSEQTLIEQELPHGRDK